MAKKYMKTTDVSDFEKNDIYVIQGVKINSKDEFFKLLKIIKESKKEVPTICVDRDTLYELMDSGLISDDTDIILEVKSVKDVKKGEIDSLKERIGLKSIAIIYQDDTREYSDIYDIDELKKIQDQIEKIMENINENQNELEKFLTVYIMLGKLIYYDIDYNFEPNRRPDAHCMTGGLLEGRCVCEGFSKILQQTLNYIGLDSKIILGEAYGEDELHAWNQVNIDGRWYNCDLTWDYYNIENNNPLGWCLLGNEEFMDHVPTEGNSEECLTTFDRIILEESRGKIQSELVSNNALLVPIGIDEEEWYLVNYGLTKDERICYLIARGNAKSEEEKERIVDEFIGAKLYNIEKLKGQAKEEKFVGNLEELLLHLYDCRRSGKNIYVIFKGKRFYSCGKLNEDEIWIEATGLRKREKEEVLNQIINGNIGDNEGEFYQQIETMERKNRRLLEARREYAGELLREFDYDAHQERMRKFKEERKKNKSRKDKEADI